MLISCTAKGMSMAKKEMKLKLKKISKKRYYLYFQILLGKKTINFSCINRFKYINVIIAMMNEWI